MSQMMPPDQPPQASQGLTPPVPQLSQPATPQAPEQEPSLPKFPVNSYDNHAVHILYHNRYRKTQAFENAPDEAKKIFEEHVQQHQLALQAGVQPTLPGTSDGAFEGYAQTDASNNQQPQGGGVPNPSPTSAVGGLMGPLGMKGQL